MAKDKTIQIFKNDEEAKQAVLAAAKEETEARVTAAEVELARAKQSCPHWDDSEGQYDCCKRIAAAKQELEKARRAEHA